MTTCLGKSCPFRALLCVAIVKVYQFTCLLLSLLILTDNGVWDLIVLVPDHFIFHD